MLVIPVILQTMPLAIRLSNACVLKCALDAYSALVTYSSVLNQKLRMPSLVVVGLGGGMKVYLCIIQTLKRQGYCS